MFDKYLGYDPPARTSNSNCQRISIDLFVVPNRKKKCPYESKGHKNKKNEEKKGHRKKRLYASIVCRWNDTFVVHFYFIFIEKFWVKRHSKTQNGNDGNSFVNFMCGQWCKLNFTAEE